MNLKNSNNSESEEHSREFRCICRQLMAKLAAGGLQIKCKRCKRVVQIPISELQISPDF